MENRKRVVSLIVLCVSIVALSVSLTFAYFVASVPDPVNETLSVTSGNLRLIFRDNSAEITPGINGTWNFGDSIEKEVAIENNGTQDLYAQILWENLVNTYLPESLTYTLEEKSSETGSTYKKVITTSKNVPQSTTASTQELADHLLVPAGKTNIYKITVTLEDLPDIDQTADLNASFITKFTLKQGTKIYTLADYLNEVNKKTDSPNFASTATTDETADGLYSLVDDSGNPSYYYRGAVTNNYVKFGKNKSGQDMYWRIIRFNGDGTVRMQYDGAGTANDPNYTYTRGFALTSQIWNTNRDDAKYVGWMFGGTQGTASTSKAQAQANETPSEIKNAIDTWYKENIYDTGWHDYIADEIFCNDRSTPGQSETGWSSDTGLGYAKNVTAYGATSRTNAWNADTSKVKPSFVCPQESDKFTVSPESGGNGKLTYPVGLITADEIVAAGSGKYGTTNQSYYLYKESWYWSFSPYDFNNNYAYVFFVNNNGRLDYMNVNKTNGAVAPVINIKAEYVNQLVGNGITSDPYHLPNAQNS